MRLSKSVLNVNVEYEKLRHRLSTFDYRPMSVSRRRFLERTVKVSSAIALSLLGSYALSKIPMTAAQTVNAPVTEIDVDTLRYPVTFDGKVEKDEWYNDSYPYESQVLLIENCCFITPRFEFRTKHDDKYTYQAFDSPTTKTSKAHLLLFFDTKSTRGVAPGADGVYNLALVSSSSGFTEVDTIPGTSIKYSGTSFYSVFKKGVDYDWRFYVGPSPLSPDNHLQFEIKVLTGTLTNNAKTNSEGNNQINFYAGLADDSGKSGDAHLAANSLPMIFKNLHSSNSFQKILQCY